MVGISITASNPRERTARHVWRGATLVMRPSSLNPLAQARDLQLTPAATLLRKEFVETFRCAVDQLEDEAREIILMRHVEQLTNSQAAELLGLSEPAASMRYLRALRQLKSLLAARGREGEVGF